MNEVKIMARKKNRNGWERYQKHVLAELERFNESHDKIVEKLEKVRIDIAKLQVKAGITGAIGGLLGAIGLMLLKGG